MQARVSAVRRRSLPNPWTTARSGTRVVTRERRRDGLEELGRHRTQRVRPVFATIPETRHRPRLVDVAPGKRLELADSHPRRIEAAGPAGGGGWEDKDVIASVFELLCGTKTQRYGEQVPNPLQVRLSSLPRVEAEKNHSLQVRQESSGLPISSQASPQAESRRTDLRSLRWRCRIQAGRVPFGRKVRSRARRLLLVWPERAVELEERRLNGGGLVSRRRLWGGL